MKINLFILFFILSINVFANDQRRDEVLKIIEEEIQEVNRLSRQYKGQNPSVLFRRSELFLEKGRIYKEIENEKYLEIPAQKRRKLKKNLYFKNSYQNFVSAKNTALKLLKLFPKYERASDVYYILGFNEKEFGSSKKALSYLQRADRTAAPGSKSKIRAQNALAEIYYNQNNYSKAIEFYEKNLKALKDRWWTKDAYNLAWSHFRIRNFERAINLMKEVEKLSKKSTFIDMSGDVQKDIGLFYAESGRIEEGVEHFRQYNRDYALELITIGEFLKESGKYAQALSILSEALKISKSDKNRVKIYLSRIQLFDKYEKVNYHLKDCIELYKLTEKNVLTRDQNEIFKFQVQKQIGKIQKQIASPTYKNSKAVIQLKVNQVISYLALSKSLNPAMKQQSDFYIAETYFQADDYEAAISHYEKSYAVAKDKSDLKLKKLSLEGMLAAIAVPDSKFPNKEKYYDKVYGLYLKENPNSSKTKEIYKRLYKAEYNQENVVAMKKILDQYNKSFPKDVETQEKMLNSLITIYDKKKNTAELSLLISEISSGKYPMSKKGKDNLYEVFQKIEIKKVETNLAKGNLGGATEGYLKIYTDAKVSGVAKANAAYNLMVINYKGQRLQETYTWGVRAIKLMERADVSKYKTTFLSVTKYLFDRMQYLGAGDLSHRTLGKICALKTNVKNGFYNNALISYRAVNDIRKVERLSSLIKQCGLNSENSLNTNQVILSYYHQNKDFQNLARLVEGNQNDMRLFDDLIFYSYEIYQYYLQNALRHKLGAWQSLIQNFYNQSVQNKLKISTRSLDIIAIFEFVNFEKIYLTTKSMRLAFPEDVFNNILKQKIAGIERLTTEALRIQKIGSGKGIIETYERLIESYEKLSIEVASFTPPDKNAEYIQSFKNAMSQIAGPLMLKSKELRAQAKSIVEKNEILAVHSNPQVMLLFNYLHDLNFYDQERIGK